MASIVAKVWDHADRVGRRSREWQPRSALVTGAGAIALLAALLARQRGLDVSVFDHVTSGREPQLARDLGARSGVALPPDDELEPDIIIECTGAIPVIADVLTRSAAAGIVCLAGLSSGAHAVHLDSGHVNRRMVLENDVVLAGRLWRGRVSFPALGLRPRSGCVTSRGSCQGVLTVPSSVGHSGAATPTFCCCVTAALQRCHL